MASTIKWFEIPATDMKRALDFYEQILDVQIHVVDMTGFRMGFFPSDGQSVSGAVVSGEGYTPSAEGSIVYLDGGEDLSGVLSRIEPAGGKIIVPKTQISPEHGYFAFFTDTEGNRVGLHSDN